MLHFNTNAFTEEGNHSLSTDEVWSNLVRKIVVDRLILAVALHDQDNTTLKSKPDKEDDGDVHDILSMCAVDVGESRVFCRANDITAESLGHLCAVEDAVRWQTR